MVFFAFSGIAVVFFVIGYTMGDRAAGRAWSETMQLTLHSQKRLLEQFDEVGKEKLS